VELNAALGGRAVQYREVQGNETDNFLSYFKPCIIPEEGGVASGFKHVEVNEREHVPRLFVCRGKHTVHVKEVKDFCPFTFVSLFLYDHSYLVTFQLFSSETGFLCTIIS
jgi:hypothetical protein